MDATTYTNIGTLIEDSSNKTCIGRRQQDGRRCCAQVSQASRQSAQQLACKLQSQYDNSKWGTFYTDLRKLASLLLCKRYHQDQVKSITKRWLTFLQVPPETPDAADSLREDAVRMLRRPQRPKRRTAARTATHEHSTSEEVQRRPWTRSMGRPPTSFARNGEAACTAGCAPLSQPPDDDDCAICLQDSPASEWVKYKCCGKCVHVHCAQEWQNFGASTCPFWYDSIHPSASAIQTHSPAADRSWARWADRNVLAYQNNLFSHNRRNASCFVSFEPPFDLFD